MAKDFKVPVTVNGIEVPTVSSVSTLTNKRVQPRTATLAAGTTYTPTGDTIDLQSLSAPTAAFTIANPTGTPTQGQTLRLRMLTGTTAYAATWGTLYSGGNIGLPASFPVSTTVNMVFMYDTTAVKWVLVGIDLPTAAYLPLQIKAMRTVTAATTITSTDGVVFFNSTAAVSQALPTTGLTAPFVVKIINANTGTLTITTTVSGTANRTQARYAAVDYLWDGSAWWLA